LTNNDHQELHEIVQTLARNGSSYSPDLSTAPTMCGLDHYLGLQTS
jgi:hypothetical protein